MRYIYCHPLFDERKCSHRFSYHLQKHFEQNNLVLERFDYTGTGESQTDFADVTFSTLLEDISIKTCKESCGLIGLRFGATLAFHFCMQTPGLIKKIIMIEPIISGQEYVDYIYRKQNIKDVMTGFSSSTLNDDGFENIEGYKTNIKLINAIKESSIIEQIQTPRPSDSITIFHISNSTNLPKDIRNLKDMLDACTIQNTIEIIKLPMFWERIPETDYNILVSRILEMCHA